MLGIVHGLYMYSLSGQLDTCHWPACRERGLPRRLASETNPIKKEATLHDCWIAQSSDVALLIHTDESLF